MFLGTYCPLYVHPGTDVLLGGESKALLSYVALGFAEKSNIKCVNC